MNDFMYSWDVRMPLSTKSRSKTVRDSFTDCGFSIRTYFSPTTGSPISTRFTVDHVSSAAMTYWELRYGLVGIFTEIIISEVEV